MRQRDAIGKRIIRVNQERVWNPLTNSWFIDVQSIVLENGVHLVPNVVETEGEYGIEIKVWRASTKRVTPQLEDANAKLRAAIEAVRRE